MKIIDTTSGFAELARVRKNCVLTVGNFDGVHLGHQEILAAARQTAAKRKAELIVMTFEPHPLAVLYPQKPPGILTVLPLKKHLLAEFGVDYLFVVKSTLELLNLSPRKFVQQFVAEKIQPSVVVEGRSFNFGCDRAGNVDVLQKLAIEMGFEVSIIKAKEVKLTTGQTVTVSSTVIRDLLASGRAADAAIALGRPYRLIGQVVPGRGKGKQLGFPTANLQPTQQLVPEEGVYAGFVGIADSEAEACAAKERLPAAFSIIRPETFGSEHALSIEAHLLIEDVGPLYDKWLAMDFVRRIRGQQKFEADADLSAQIAKDCEKAKNILATDFTD